MNEPVILFDGVCNYCNAMVKFAIRNDCRGRLRFAPLQSTAGLALRQEYQIAASIDSVIFIDAGTVYTHSDAAFRICKWLDWPVRALYAFVIVPRFIRQPIYRWIARNRYKWFGKTETCMIPTPEVRSRFLE